MNHLAVDLGSAQSQCVERTPDSSIVRSVRVKSTELKKVFSATAKSRVVLEACSEAFTVADWASAEGHEVCIVPATLAPALGVGARGVKTDKRDAENLSLASCRMAKLPSVHRPSLVAKELRAHLASRALLVATRTMHVNHLRGYLRQQLISMKKGSATMARRVREELLARPQGIPLHIELVLQMLELVNEKIRLADQELKRLVESDGPCQRLMTVPGVGPVTAAAFRASVDVPSRFPNAHALQSYLGLTPGEASSGERTRRLGISKAGPSMVRWTLIQAAWAAWRYAKGDPMVKWANQLAERRPKQVAVTALARKMAGILFALWRDETTYAPQQQS
jgi:transposase